MVFWGPHLMVQGQLKITGKKTCSFIVYMGDKEEIFVEKITRDEGLWTETMLPKLIKFYKDCLAPEIILNRRQRNLKCRDPPYILESNEEEKEKNEYYNSNTEFEKVGV